MKRGGLDNAAAFVQGVCRDLGAAARTRAKRRNEELASMGTEAILAADREDWDTVRLLFSYIFIHIVSFPFFFTRCQNYITKLRRFSPSASVKGTRQSCLLYFEYSSTTFGVVPCQWWGSK